MVACKNGRIILDNQYHIPNIIINTDINKSNLKAILHDMLDQIKNTNLDITDMVLFGSYARNEAKPNDESDIDILIIYKNNINSMQAIQMLLDIEINILNNYGIVLMCIPKTEEKYNDPINFNLAQNIQKDGIRIWN